MAFQPENFHPSPDEWNRMVEDVDLLSAVSKEPATVSNVCALLAESEVINHIVDGVAPPDIMLGALAALVERAVQLISAHR